MQKLLKSILVYLLTSVGTVAFAIPTSFSGFYAGGSIGEGFTIGKGITNSLAVFNYPISGLPPFNFMSNQDRNFSIKSNKSECVFFVGLGGNYHQLYIAAELFINSNSSKTQIFESTNNPMLFSIETFTVNTSSVTDIRAKPFGFGFDLRPGVLLTDTTLLFARLGAIRKRIKISSQVKAVNYNNDSSFPDFNDKLPISLSVNRQRDVFTFRTGGGIEQFLSDCLSIRMDYIYSNYGRIKAANSTAIPIFSKFIDASGVASLNSATRVKLHNHSILLGLSYHW